MQPIAENNEEDKVIKQSIYQRYNPDRGDTYKGTWKEGKANGKGKFSIKSIGVCTFANGDKYDGQWKENRLHGKGKHFFKFIGTYYFSNGNKYRGEWKYDARCGRGIVKD